MKSTTIIHSKGYLLSLQPKHPFANKDGYVPEHRLIMEDILGRFINPQQEDVHHKDTNIKTNSLDNLILVTKGEHRRIHAGWLHLDDGWWKVCSRCNRLLKVEGNFYKRHRGHNEYVSRCNDCIRQISSNSRPPKLSHEERSHISSVSVIKAWHTRRNKQEGGE